MSAGFTQSPHNQHNHYSVVNYSPKDYLWDTLALTCGETQYAEAIHIRKGHNHYHIGNQDARTTTQRGKLPSGWEPTPCY